MISGTGVLPGCCHPASNPRNDGNVFNPPDDPVSTLSADLDGFALLCRLVAFQHCNSDKTP
jgi:hypothetical protein